MFLADQRKSDGFGRPWGWVFYDVGWTNSLKGIGTLCILGYNLSNLKFKSDKTLKSVD